MVYSYLIHGIVLALPFACPELGNPCRDLEGGITVTAGSVPLHLENAVQYQRERDLSPAVMLFRGGRRSARFLVEYGSVITYEKNPSCEEPIFLHHLLGPVLVGALWQRGAFVLHASSVLSPDGAVLVTGPSGAGKSTSIARLLAEGWPLLSDDVTVIGSGDDGWLDVFPGTRSISLDARSSALLGFDTRRLECRAWHRHKMCVPVRQAEATGSVPVARIVFLQQAAEFAARTVRGRDKVKLLLQAIYGPVLPDVVAKLEVVLGQMLRHVGMIAIGRPPGRWTLEDVVGVIRDG